MNTTKVVKTKVQAFVTDAEGKPTLNEKGEKVPAPSVETTLTIDWSDVTPDEIKAMAQLPLIVKLQGGWRKNGIPREATVKASEHKVGVRTPAVKLSPEEQAMALDAEAKKALIARLQADLAGA